jgi:hypothetical protein
MVLLLNSTVKEREEKKKCNEYTFSLSSLFFPDETDGLFNDGGQRLA